MKKTHRNVLIVLISLTLIFFGVLIYFRYDKTTEVDETIANNYYSSEFLFNNNYIRPADSIENAKNLNKDLDIHKEGNKLRINLLNQSAEIYDLPEKSNVYFNQLDSDFYEFAALDGKDLYYAKTRISNKNIKKFEKISTAAKAVYVPNIYKEGMYINEKPKSNFIIDTTLGKLKYISYEKETLGLYNDIAESKPYFDYVCASDNVTICKHLIVYVSFSKELFYNNEVIRTNYDEKLIVTDLFGVLKINNGDDNLLNNLEYEKLKKYDYQFEIYVLDKDNYLYKVVINKNKKDIPIAEKINNQKIKLIDYKKDKNENIEKVILTDTDGKTTTIINEKNSIISDSTIYERKSVIDTLKK